MKENVMDILRYLFESYLQDDEPEEPLVLTGKHIQKELSLAGFDKQNIENAFEWLDDLEKLKQVKFELCQQTPRKSIRIYDDFEQQHFGFSARDFLHKLEQKGVIDFNVRELIIERAMALNIEKINEEQMQWIAMMVLFNMSGTEDALPWLENVVFNEQLVVH